MTLNLSFKTPAAQQMMYLLSTSALTPPAIVYSSFSSSLPLSTAMLWMDVVNAADGWVLLPSGFGLRFGRDPGTWTCFSPETDRVVKMSEPWRRSRGRHLHWRYHQRRREERGSRGGGVLQEESSRQWNYSRVESTDQFYCKKVI